MDNAQLGPSYTHHDDADPTTAPEDFTVVALGSDNHEPWRFGSAKNLAVEFVRRVTVEWQLPYLAGVAEEITARLVTRSVATTGNPKPPPRYSQVVKNLPPLIGVRLTRIPVGLLVEVWDSDSTTPIPATGRYFDEDLLAVSKISAERSQRWNWYQAPCGGKVIWAELRRVTNTRGTTYRVAC